MGGVTGFCPACKCFSSPLQGDKIDIPLDGNPLETRTGKTALPWPLAMSVVLGSVPGGALSLEALRCLLNE